MAIKSLEELRKLRASLQNSVTLREQGETPDNELIEVLVGLGTCGIAAGARETFNRFLTVIEEKELKEIKVVSVGCIGQCNMEPTVQINIPGSEPVIYGKITEDKVDNLVETVIVKRELLDENLLIKTFNKAVV